jgi:hypothetical protein
MDPEDELRQRLEAAMTVQARRKRASAGRLRREIREAFERQEARELGENRQAGVKPNAIRDTDRTP